MKVLVIGSGLIGVTTAYFFRRLGHEVMVIDRAEDAGQETSFANGALLTPNMPEPWNAPGCWRVLLASLGRSDAALQLRLRALPGLARWGLMFLRNSAASTFEDNTLSNLRLALYSLDVMEALRQQTGIEYGRTARGTLRVFRDPAALGRASAAAVRLSSEGLSFKRLSANEAVDLEPALAPIANELTGALHSGSDETGNALRFWHCSRMFSRRRSLILSRETLVRPAADVSRRRSHHWFHTYLELDGEYGAWAPWMDDGSRIRSAARGPDVRRSSLRRPNSLCAFALRDRAMSVLILNTLGKFKDDRYPVKRERTLFPMLRCIAYCSSVA